MRLYQKLFCTGGNNERKNNKIPHCEVIFLKSIVTHRLSKIMRLAVLKTLCLEKEKKKMSTTKIYI